MNFYFSNLKWKKVLKDNNWGLSLSVWNWNFGYVIDIFFVLLLKVHTQPTWRRWWTQKSETRKMGRRNIDKLAEDKEDCEMYVFMFLLIECYCIPW